MYCLNKLGLSVLFLLVPSYVYCLVTVPVSQRKAAYQVGGTNVPGGSTPKCQLDLDVALLTPPHDGNALTVQLK